MPSTATTSFFSPRPQSEIPGNGIFFAGSHVDSCRSCGHHIPRFVSRGSFYCGRCGFPHVCLYRSQRCLSARVPLLGHRSFPCANCSHAFRVRPSSSPHDLIRCPNCLLLYIYERNPVVIPDSRPPRALESTSVVDSLPIKLFPPNSKVQEECSICMEDFRPNSESGEIVNELPCTHCFHNRCIVEWFKRRRTCPLCRYKLPSSGRRRRRRQRQGVPIRTNNNAGDRNDQVLDEDGDTLMMDSSSS